MEKDEKWNTRRENNAKVKENEQGNTKKGNEVCIGNECRRSVCRNYETVYQCWKTENRKQKARALKEI